MFVALRTLTYASLFIAFVLVYLPARVLAWAGIQSPGALGPAQWTAMVLGAAGAFVALWCVGAFAWIGKGTPAPFDPPRRLVIRGPYRFVRNPMYIGASLAVAAAALYFGSWALLLFVAGFLLVCHTFVVTYEEPHLRRVFGREYEAYCRDVKRWIPRFGSATGAS
jgi:protein-S-isoprenylcysteine O-methyltransferase Ste14